MTSSPPHQRIHSPNLSIACSTPFTTTATNNFSRNGDNTAAATNLQPGVNYADVFAELDWNAVDLVDLETRWRQELEQIEKVPMSFRARELTIILPCRTMPKRYKTVQVKLN